MSFVGPSARVRYPGAAVALLLAVSTFGVRGHNAEAVAWAVVQLVLVTIAAVDVETRRIPNMLTLATAAAVLALRLVFARDALAETLATGAICFAIFLLLSSASRGALGIGDVKLSGLAGLLLGEGVFPALLIGTICGAVAAVVVARRAGSRKATLAYGPYLCLGAAVVILVAAPPALV